MGTNLMLHAGSNAASESDVFAVSTPDATETWQPVPHSRLIASVQQAVELSGFTIAQREYGLFNDGARMFGVWALTNHENAPDYQLAIGLRNSHDKRFPAGLAVGSRVFVCDNLAFSSEIVVARKHTSRILQDLDRLVLEAVGRVGEARQMQDVRIAAYKNRELSALEAHDLLIRSVDAGVMANSYIPKVLDEYRNTEHEEFAPRTAWSLFNAYTEVFKGTNPLDLPARTTRLHGLLDLTTDALIQPPSDN